MLKILVFRGVPFLVIAWPQVLVPLNSQLVVYYRKGGTTPRLRLCFEEPSSWLTFTVLWIYKCSAYENTQALQATGICGHACSPRKKFKLGALRSLLRLRLGQNETKTLNSVVTVASNATWSNWNQVAWNNCLTGEVFPNSWHLSRIWMVCVRKLRSTRHNFGHLKFGKCPEKASSYLSGWSYYKCWEIIHTHRLEFNWHHFFTLKNRYSLAMPAVPVLLALSRVFYVGI